MHGEKGLIQLSKPTWSLKQHGQLQMRGPRKLQHDSHKDTSFSIKKNVPTDSVASKGQKSLLTELKSI